MIAKTVKAEKRYLSVEEAAEYLNIHPDTLRALSASGHIRPSKLPLGGKRLFLRYDRQDLDKFMQRIKEEL